MPCSTSGFGAALAHAPGGGSGGDGGASETVSTSARFGAGPTPWLLWVSGLSSSSRGSRMIETERLGEGEGREEREGEANGTVDGKDF